MGPRGGSLGCQKTLTDQAWTPGSFAGTPIPLPYGFYLLSSRGLDFQDKGKEQPFPPPGVLAGPESRDLANWNSMSTGVMFPSGQREK